MANNWDCKLPNVLKVSIKKQAVDIKIFKHKVNVLQVETLLTHKKLSKYVFIQRKYLNPEKYNLILRQL